MTLFLLCSWSSILIFVWMVRRKYYWTMPPYWVFLGFVVVGAVSTLPALICNTFLSTYTEFWAFSGNRFYSFMGFCLGAGFGEEFWKLGAGLVLLLLLRAWRGRDLSDAARVLGMVVIGLTFAALENLISYSELGFWALIARGFVSVPLHGTMGAIHGLAINVALRKSRAMPLFIGYLMTALLHTLCDTWNLFIPTTSSRDAIAVLVVLMVVLISWGRRCWIRVPEVTALESEH